VQKASAAIQKNQIDDANLKLELAESRVMEKPSMESSMITKLKQYHVQTAIDDFGIGYSAELSVSISH